MRIPMSGFNGAIRSSSYKTADTTSVNWNNIPHKGMATLSQSELRQRVSELGVEFANATSDEERGKIGDEVQNLYNQYVSYVSPDRKSLYNQALKTIKEQSGNNESQKKATDATKTLIDYLNEHDKGMKYDKTYPMTGGGTVTASKVTGGGAIFDVKYSGENVLSIHTGSYNGVSYSPTGAEQSMMKEISNVFYNARENANTNTATKDVSKNKINLVV